MSDGVPTLVVVSGPPGAFGKTTLAHKLAREIGCPAICRDEVKEGMVHANPGFQPGPGDALTQRTLPTFFSLIRLLIGAGCSVVAEAAFQHSLWAPQLDALAPKAKLRVIICGADRDVAAEREMDRHTHNQARRAHTPPPGGRRGDEYQPISIAAPTLAVDTTDGYEPSFQQILQFIGSPSD